MRLIDADALKKAINDNVCRHSHYFDIFDVIDNAPTVEQSPVIGEVISFVERDSRPKGEWIEHSTYKGVLICSHCNHGETQAYDTFKFCPNCGADMR